MRGDDHQTTHLFSYLSPEQRVPADHPLRAVRRMTDAALDRLSPRFALMYSRIGRPSVPPEQLLRALLVQILYSVRSERLLMEQLQYNLPFRWFVGLAMDDMVWTPTTFTKNRERLLAGDIAQAFFADVLQQAADARLMSDEHFTVDGTLLEAAAGVKSFRAKGATVPPPDDPSNPTVNFHGERRSNATHQSTTDPDSRLLRKSGAHEAKLHYVGGVLIENRHGLVVQAAAVVGTGTAERDVAIAQVTTLPRGGKTVGADKGFDQRPFVDAVRAVGVTPHVAAKKTCSAIDGRTTRHPGYAVSQRVRKRIEEVFGWMKTVGLLRKLRHRGVARVNWIFVFTAAAYNLVRMRTLAGRPA
jgi:transposase